MGRPHLYGFAWQGNDQEQAPSVWDFQGNNLVETLGEDVENVLKTTNRHPSEDDIEKVREHLVDIGILPVDAEVVSLEELEEKKSYLSGPVLRKCYHSIVDQLFPDEQAKWEKLEGSEAAAIVSELARGRRLLTGEKPMSRVEAVIDFLDMGPYGDCKPSILLDALNDLHQRIEAYEALPAPFDVDDLIKDPGQMGLNEMIEHPEWIKDSPDVDADELRRSFSPDPL